MIYKESLSELKETLYSLVKEKQKVLLVTDERLASLYESMLTSVC
jgi:hypothetical protein